MNKKEREKQITKIKNAIIDAIEDNCEVGSISQDRTDSNFSISFYNGKVSICISGTIQ